MKKYKVRSASTIYAIKYAKDNILTKIGQQGGMSKRKRFKNPRYPQVDEALYIWFLQKRQRHQPVSQEMLQVQAKKFFNQMIGTGDYGSRGYVEKFIKRNGIRLLKISGEKLSSNISVVEKYKKDFAAQIREEDLSPCQIFNADESGLFFKRTPTRTYVEKDAKSAPGFKMNKDRITFMPCSNMDGSLKLPLMLIGKSHRPRALKNLKELPVYYRASKSAWMEKVLFKEWFFGEFVPKVTAFLKSKGLPVKAALVLDNCTAHYNADELKTADGSIFTIFLPANTTAVLQPMDQNIIQMIKTRYRNLMMQEIQARGGELDDCVKKVNIKDVIFWVAQAWEVVPADSICKSWNMLYNTREIEDEDDVPLSVLRDTLRSIGEKIAQAEEIDEEDAEFETLSDDEIIASVLHKDADEDISYAGDDTMHSMSTQEEASHSASFGDDDKYMNVSDEAALNGFDLVIRYAEENNWPLTTQFSLRHMRSNVMDIVIQKEH
ncbi:jerky protein homolog-like [Armigeres subalbatus]|uniref:jerky protein homolog-like n=1 Tax=Armigeres subalbatus TaxID=124917 RepID=UPI002ED27C64